MNTTTISHLVIVLFSLLNLAPVRADLMADSPVKFPAQGALPTRFPPDQSSKTNESAEKDYYIFRTPERSLAQIGRIQAEMPAGEFTPPPQDWRNLRHTRRLLTEGGDLRLLALGDSIVNDTMRSGWVAKLQEAYPKARIQATVYVRGGGGCQHYKEENRLAQNVVPRRPDLVFIGGISQKDIASIREVIHQLRTALPDVEILLATGAFGTADPRDPEALAKAGHSGTGPYGEALKKLADDERCAYLDMTTPWAEYLRSAKVHPHRFYRDVVHANEYGEQILSKILMAFWALPQPAGAPPALKTAAVNSGEAGRLSVADSNLDASIRRIRMGTLVIEAPPGTEVRVEQLRHEFWFGAALASQMFGSRSGSEEAVRYKQVFLQNFNAAVTENALKWHSMEPRPGEVDYTVVDAILEWAKAQDIPLRGHNVFWGVPNMVQPWLKALDDATLRETLKTRALDIARRYRGRFAEYDLNNEMLHGNYYEQRLGPNITRDMVSWMHQEDPQAVLYLNEYDILTGRRLEDYVVQIRKFLDQGVAIGGIGVQGHLHGDSFDPIALQQALDRLAPFKLPVRVTEFNFPGQRSKYYGQRSARLSDEEEQAKARALVDYYRLCFAHPAVEGILMWGFWERANWIPVSSLFRRDWSATPAAAAYRDLVFNQWWTSWRGQTDAQGRCEVRAFFGKHRVMLGSREQLVHLQPAKPTILVK